MPLERMKIQSEPYGSSGNIGENFRKLLGAPGLDPLQTLVRETVQNISDAAKLGRGPQVVFRLRELTKDQVQVLRTNVLVDLPMERHSQKELSRFLREDRPIVLEICDFGTSGLGGPTRADKMPIGTKSTDFIDFIRNVGSVRDTAHGGGTYGFGKVSLYKVSKCSTILVDSMVSDGGPGSRRLIGCHIGSSFNLEEGDFLQRYTGRHWWGKPSELDDSFVEPLIDEAASDLADALGFEKRTVAMSGTSIMILDFELGEDSVEVVGRQIVESLLWNFWPRMMQDAPAERRFSCKVEVNSVSIPIPQPENFPPLDLFCKAMTAARNRAGDNIHAINSRRPKRELGILATQRGLRGKRSYILENDSLFPSSARHIALMRPVELVVKYLEGTALPDERLEWAGVFLASSENDVERSFAESEPPAHDDWIAANLPKGAMHTYVNVALKQLHEYALAMGGEGQQLTENKTVGPPLARVAARLGAMLEGTSGDGAGKSRLANRGSGNGGSTDARPQKARVSRPQFLRLENDELGALATFTLEVRQDLRRTARTLVVQAAVAVDGGTASKLTDLIDPPEIIAISGGNPTISTTKNQIDLDGTEGIFEVLVRMPKDCAVTLAAELAGSSDK